MTKITQHIFGCYRLLAATILITLCQICIAPATAEAATRTFTQRYSTNANGDIYLIGNTAMTCNESAGALNNTACANAKNGIGTGAQLNNNNYSMIFVDIDGDATTFQSSSAILSMPSGSTVLWAGLYWGGEYITDTARDQVRFKTPGSGGYVTVNAIQDDYIPNVGCVGNSCDRYSAIADVTNLVSAGGSGTYTVANIRGTPNSATASTYAGWSLVVAFSNTSEPMRNLVVNDGFTSIACGYPTSVNIPVSGFITPYNGPVNTTMGAIAGEGDLGSTGDNFQLNGVNLVNPVRVANNFFNTSISELGARVTTNNPNFYNQLGWDVARVNASGILANGATSATLTLNTGGECYYPSTVTFATELYVPIIVPNVSKVGVDVNGGNLVPGDILRYTIAMNNTGLDTGTNLSVIDNIPAFTSYVPGSLKVVTGPPGAPTGTMTDVSGDDVAEYIATGTPRVIFRLGTGANALTGGNLAQGQSTSLSFDVQLSTTIPAGTILTNQAQISYSGQTLGAVYAAASSAAASAVFVPPVPTKTFTPPVVGDTSGTATLSIVFNNPATNLGAVNGVAVTDTYPAGMVNATPANPTLSCTPGSTAGSIVGGIAGGNTIGMTGTSIAQNGSCTLSVTVKGTAAGNFTNNLDKITTSNAGESLTPSATATFSVGRPGISKAFSSPSILTGNNATLTFTLTNPTATDMTVAAFTDSYPSGLVNATPLTIGGSCAAKTVDAATIAGGGVFNLTGANIPAPGGSCTVTVLVTSSAAGSYNNTTSGVTTNETPSAGAPSNTANLLVYAPLTATKTFTPASISTSGASQLAITITNPNPSGMAPVTGAAFTDTYPANLFNSSTPTPVVTCTAGSSATLTGGAAGPANTIGMSGGVIAPGESCTITVFVASSTAGDYTDSADTITTTNAGTSSVPAASLNVSAFTPPGSTKSFVTPIARNQSSTMTIALTNSNASAITGAAFTDSYPAGLINTATPNGTTTCTGGTVTAAAGGNSLILANATIPTSGCSVTVNVTSATAGNYYNNTGLITTTNAGVGAGASGSLQVLAPPTVAKSFSVNPIASSGATIMTLTLTNPSANTVDLTGVGIIDTYPAGMTNGVAASGATTCTGGTVTAANNGPSVSLANATLPVGTSCTVTVNIKAPAAAGEYTNTTNPVTTTNAGNGTSGATAILSVGRPGISKSFGTSPILAGGSSLLTITLSNPTGVDMTAAAFTDTYPAGMTNWTAANGTTNCGTGTVTAANNGPSVSLSGGTIPTTGCWVRVTVTATTTSSNTIPAGALTVSGGASNANPATAVLQVTPPPQISKTFTPAAISTSASYTAGNVALGRASTLTIEISNLTSSTISNFAFTDTYPLNVIKNGVAAAGATTSCTAGSSIGTVTAALNGSSLAITSGTRTLLGNGICSVSIPVYVTTAGNYINSTGPITSNSGTGPAASASLMALAPFTGSKTFSPSSINAGDVTTLIITLNNSNTTAVTGVSFSDLYPTGLTNAATPAYSSTCGGAVTAAAGDNSLVFSGGTIPASGSCAVTVNVTSTSGNKTNPAFTVSSSNAGTSTVLAANLTLVAYTAPTAVKSFSAVEINVGATAVMTIVLNNPNSGSGNRNITQTSFTDNLPTAASGVTMKVAAGAPTNTCGGTLTATVGSATVILTGGTIPENGSCQITIPVTTSAPGTYVNNTGPITSSNAATGNSASASLVTVLAPPTVTKSFSPTSVPLGSSSTLTITVANPAANGTNDITGVNFLDTFPSVVGPPAGQMVIATPLNLTNSCGGTATAVAGGTSLSLVNGTIPSTGSSSCAVTVNVIGAAKGSYLNSTGEVNTTNSPPQSTPGTATMVVYTDANLTVLKTADKPAAKPGDIITYTLQFFNTGDVDASNISVSDVMSRYVAFGTNSYPSEPVPPGPVFEFTGSGSPLPTPGTPQFFDSSNGSISPTPPYDGAVAKWTIPFTGTLGGGANFIIRYKTQIK